MQNITLLEDHGTTLYLAKKQIRELKKMVVYYYHLVDDSIAARETCWDCRCRKQERTTSGQSSMRSDNCILCERRISNQSIIIIITMPLLIVDKMRPPKKLGYTRSTSKWPRFWQVYFTAKLNIHTVYDLTMAIYSVRLTKWWGSRAMDNGLPYLDPWPMWPIQKSETFDPLPTLLSVYNAAPLLWRIHYKLTLTCSLILKFRMYQI